MKSSYDYSADEDLTKGTGKIGSNISSFMISELNEDVSQWEIKAAEIKLESKIGEGSYGVVYKGVLRYFFNIHFSRTRGKEVAVKKLFASNLDADTLESFRKEVAIMAYLFPLYVSNYIEN